jgi:hypothetical protein
MREMDRKLSSSAPSATKRRKTCSVVCLQRTISTPIVSQVPPGTGILIVVDGSSRELLDNITRTK